MLKAKPLITTRLTYCKLPTTLATLASMRVTLGSMAVIYASMFANCVSILVIVLSVHLA